MWCLLSFRKGSSSPSRGGRELFLLFSKDSEVSLPAIRDVSAVFRGRGGGGVVMCWGWNEGLWPEKSSESEQLDVTCRN